MELFLCPMTNPSTIFRPHFWTESIVPEAIKSKYESMVPLGSPHHHQNDTTPIDTISSRKLITMSSLIK